MCFRGTVSHDFSNFNRVCIVKEKKLFTQKQGEQLLCDTRPGHNTACSVLK